MRRCIAPRLAFILAALAAAPSLAQTPAEVRFNQVDLQAEVSREVQNDLMQASLYAEVSDASAARVAAELNRIVAEALKVAGEAKTVKTRSGAAQTYPTYDRSQKVTGWRGRSEIRLESKDVPALAALIGRLQSTLQLGGVTLTVSPELRRQTENELMTEAVAAFRARADIATKALGGKSYRIRRVALGTSGFAPGPRPMMMEAARAGAVSAGASPLPIEAGTSTVQVSANGTVEVE
jgi:predicted secreted protein